VRGFGTLLGYLRRAGAVPVPAPPSAPAPVTAEEELLDRYRRYLIGQRGICEDGAHNYIRSVRRFLAWRATREELGLGALKAADVSAFVLAECPGCSTRWGKDLTLALRSFLVFLHVDGVLEDSLAGAVPRVAGWRLAGLPRALDPGVAQRLVASCDRDTAIGRRDLAILVLLWRLALRRGEVAAMKLDDLDWRAGHVRVCGKSRRVELLPLPTVASYCTSVDPVCGFAGMARVRDALAAFDVGLELDPQPSAGAAPGWQLAVADPVVDGAF
jgi:site-specific recombinase XerC